MFIRKEILIGAAAIVMILGVLLWYSSTPNSVSESVGVSEFKELNEQVTSPGSYTDAEEESLRSQISKIRYEVSFVDHYYKSCSAAYWAVHTFNGNINAYKGMEEQGRENIKECASTQDFVEFVNNLVIEPELSDVKKELILLSDLLVDFSTEVIINENPGVDYRDKASVEIPRQKTKVLESIRSVEVERGL